MTVIVIIGPGASGKDFLRKKFQDNKFQYFPSYTTRAPRPGEEDKKDYCFVTRLQFDEWSASDFWKETAEFGGQLYGTSRLQWQSGQTRDSVFIMSPRAMLHAFTEEERSKLIVIYLDIPERIRRERMEKRGFSKEKIQERIKNDTREFEENAVFRKWIMVQRAMIIRDPAFDAQQVVQASSLILRGK